MEYTSWAASLWVYAHTLWILVLGRPVARGGSHRPDVCVSTRDIPHEATVVGGWRTCKGLSVAGKVATCARSV